MLWAMHPRSLMGRMSLGGYLGKAGGVTGPATMSVHVTHCVMLIAAHFNICVPQVKEKKSCLLLAEESSGCFGNA